MCGEYMPILYVVHTWKYPYTMHGTCMEYTSATSGNTCTVHGTYVWNTPVPRMVHALNTPAPALCMEHTIIMHGAGFSPEILRGGKMTISCVYRYKTFTT